MLKWHKRQSFNHLQKQRDEASFKPTSSQAFSISILNYVNNQIFQYFHVPNPSHPNRHSTP